VGDAKDAKGWVEWGVGAKRGSKEGRKGGEEGEKKERR
jgi:hypothetical protein